MQGPAVTDGRKKRSRQGRGRALAAAQGPERTAQSGRRAPRRAPSAGKQQAASQPLAGPNSAESRTASLHTPGAVGPRCPSRLFPRRVWPPQPFSLHHLCFTPAAGLCSERKLSEPTRPREPTGPATRPSRLTSPLLPTLSHQLSLLPLT